MKIRFLFLVLYLSILGGAIGLFAKLALSAFSPLTTTFLRISITLLFLTIILSLQKRFLAVLRTIIRNWGKMFILALSGVGAAMIIGFIGLRYTSALNYGLIYNLSSVFILIFSVFFLREKMKRLDVFFIFLAFIGAGIIATNGKLNFDISTSYIFGNLLVLVSAIGWALYSVLGAKFSRQNNEIDSSAANFGAFLISFVVLCPVILLSPSYGINFPALGFRTIFGILGLSILSTAILFFLWLRFVDKEGGIWASLVSLSENLSGVILPIIFLGDRLTLPVAVGGILMISSICGKEVWDRQRKTRLVNSSS